MKWLAAKEPSRRPNRTHQDTVLEHGCVGELGTRGREATRSRQQRRDPALVGSEQAGNDPSHDRALGVCPRAGTLAACGLVLA